MLAEGHGEGWKRRLSVLPTHPRSPSDAAVWAPGFDGDLVRLMQANLAAGIVA